MLLAMSTEAVATAPGYEMSARASVLRAWRSAALFPDRRQSGRRQRPVQRRELRCASDLGQGTGSGSGHVWRQAGSDGSPDSGDGPVPQSEPEPPAGRASGRVPLLWKLPERCEATSRCSSVSAQTLAAAAADCQDCESDRTKR